MKLVQRALWFLESHLSEDISLDDVAKACGVSAPHLVRTFGISTNLSVMQYLKARRLSEAARAFKNGAKDILSVGIMSGYDSHEAFTRAFKKHFNITPSQLRDGDPSYSMDLTEPFKIDLFDTDLQLSPKIIDQDEIKLLGLKRTYADITRGAIPRQWADFIQMIETPPIPRYGIRFDMQDDGHFEYVSAMPAYDMIGDDNTDLIPLIIKAGKVAVFRHPNHISNIRSSWHRIFNEWYPPKNTQVSGHPPYEFYSKDFDPIAQIGSVDIYVPLETI